MNSSLGGFASWIEERVEHPPAGGHATLATIGLGALLSNRLLRDVIGVPTTIEDPELIDAWVEFMIGALA